MMSFTRRPAFSIARTCSPPIYGAPQSDRANPQEPADSRPFQVIQTSRQCLHLIVGRDCGIGYAFRAGGAPDEAARETPWPRHNRTLTLPSGSGDPDLPEALQ